MATLPALATLDDLAGRMTIVDETRAQAALDAASTIIRAEVDPITWVTGGAIDEDLPAIIRTICLDLAQDRYENPSGTRSETIGGYSYTNSGETTGGRALSTLQRTQIRRAAGLPNAGTITLESAHPLAGETVYLDVDPPGEPIPWTGPYGW